MATRLVAKSILATMAGAALLLPFGAPLPGSCLRAVGVARAAPSPSCGGDLRECLRASAVLRQTTFGGRYVTADDVAKCMEAFQSCVSGGASRGGNADAPKAGAAEDDGRTGLPERLLIASEHSKIDCTISAEAATCTEQLTTAPEWIDEFTNTVTGTVSGLTMTGTAKALWRTHVPEEPSCVSEISSSGPVTYRFSRDGSVLLRIGPTRNEGTWSGGAGCSNESFTSTDPVGEITATWSEVS